MTMSHRTKKRLHNHVSSESDNEGASARNGMNGWLAELFLDIGDRLILEKNDWLVERHICTAKNLLKQQFPQMDGLELSTLSQARG